MAYQPSLSCLPHPWHQKPNHLREAIGAEAIMLSEGELSWLNGSSSR